MRLISKVINIYQREGVSSVLKKARFRIGYYGYRAFNSNKKEEERWNALKGKFKGKRAYLLGNGPSLNKTPLYLLKDEYVLCFNRFYLYNERLNFSPNFFACVDNLVLKDLVDEIPQIANYFDLLFFPDRHFRKTNFRNLIGNDEKHYWLAPVFGRGFSKNLPKVNQGGSVIYEGMQILDFLGFDEIIILGVDMNFKIHETAEQIASSKETDIKSKEDDDPNHFDPRYFGKNRSYHQPEKFVIDNIVSSLDFLGSNLELFNLKIVNCGFDSKIESFPKEDFYSKIGYSDERIKGLFEDLLVEKSGHSIDEFESIHRNLEGLELPANFNESFFLGVDEGVKLIPKLIHEFLPLGPWNNKYYFIKRNSKQ